MDRIDIHLNSPQPLQVSMAPSPPPFASQAYWDARFYSNPGAFDWLQPASILDPHILAALHKPSSGPPNILHIGCGTSLLSHHLRAHVGDPAQIHNVDFSREAITLGQAREKEIFEAQEQVGEGQSVDITSVHKPSEQNTANTSDSKRVSGSYMRWDVLDLLSVPSLRAVCHPESYSLIVEKSCSDAIACADDVPVSTPYPLTTSHGRSNNSKSSPPSSTPSSSGSSSISPERRSHQHYLHPLTLLAVHLAAISRPGAHWICLSYSSDRFPFFPPSPDISSRDMEPAVPLELLAQGFPDPAALWRLERREEVEAVIEEEGKDSASVHRPRVVHWVYVLERTDVVVDGY